MIVYAAGVVVGVVVAWAGVRLLSGHGGATASPPPKRRPFALSGAVFVFAGALTAAVAGRMFTNLWLTLEPGVFPMSVLHLDAPAEPIHIIRPGGQGRA